MKRRQLLHRLLSLPWLASLPRLRADSTDIESAPVDSHADTSRSPGSAPASTGLNRQRQRPRIAVIGAGALGGWTALQLQRQGARVSLFEAWDPGHPRSSSGGETRVIRHAYTSLHHVRLAARALQLWQQAACDWQEPLLQQTGVLFMAQSQGMGFLRQAIANLQQVGVTHELLSTAQLAQRYPQINRAGIVQAVLEPESGYLLARRACAAVVEAFRRAGGQTQRARVWPGLIRDGAMQAVQIDGQANTQFDQIVFACGPWLRQLFPDLLQHHISISRQEVMVFGTPAGDVLHDQTSLPVWADFGERIWYGIPGSERRGFKLADDSRGDTFDAEHGDRRLCAAGLAAAQTYLARRFPALSQAPLLESRVCQYSNTPDGDFIVDRHPRASNVIVLGGGNGHAFKHAPALGELVSQALLSDQPLPVHFALSRFSSASSSRS